LQITETITLMRLFGVPGADFLWLEVDEAWPTDQNKNREFIRDSVFAARVSNLSRVPTRRVILMEVRAELVDQSPVFTHPLDCS
jgi:hypothetical protein